MPEAQVDIHTSLLNALAVRMQNQRRANHYRVCVHTPFSVVFPACAPLPDRLLALLLLRHCLDSQCETPLVFTGLASRAGPLMNRDGLTADWAAFPPVTSMQSLM